MKKLISDCPLWYKFVLIGCAALILIALIVPPVGIIDHSVLCAVGEIGGIAAIGLLPTVSRADKGSSALNEEVSD